MESIDRVRDLPIENVISKYVTLKQKGANLIACCPFHDEKTPSFVVTPAKNIFKCFGCGEGGDGIAFVMKKEGLDFIDAAKSIAKQNNIDWPEKPLTDEQRKQHSHKEAIREANKIAAAWFEKNLYLPENKQYLDYALSRWDEKTLRDFSIGYAPDNSNALENYCKSIGVKRDILIDAGLIKVSSRDHTSTFDYFRNRLIVPIKDHLGRFAGFTGRAFNPKDPKYFNTAANEVFSKGNILFGFDVARKHIRERKQAILVEGNADIIRLHEINILHSVASQGTALTDQHINMLRDICDSVTIIGDNDSAGIKAVVTNAKALLKAGIFVNVVPLPDDHDNKIDPDSYFTSKEQYNKFATENIVSFLIWYTNSRKNNIKSSDGEARLINEISELLVCLPDGTRDLQVEQLARIIKPKMVWSKAIHRALAEKNKIEIIDEDGLTKEQADSLKKYGFYEKDNQYYFNVKEGYVSGSNFVMKPLFHIQSVINAKRMYEITNFYGHSETIELPQKDMISLSAFKTRVESMGNFLWEMSDTYLNKVKRYLYEKTHTCVEVNQLGWQKQGFYAWGNGIFAPSKPNMQEEGFIKTDKYGIVQYNGINYYLPAFSVIYQSEDNLFEFERKFINTQSDNINLYDYVTRLENVFGENALIAFSFLLATIFRDVIAHRFGFFPILNCFGPKGAGKSEMARSLIAFFLVPGKGQSPNINNTTKAALADKVSQVANAVVHIDEYRNDIEPEKIEFLKGIWDGTGRTRMNMDKDKKMEMTSVDCGVVLTGQQMPTADIALFSRLVYITFYQTEYSKQEKINFDELKDIEKHGLSHLTNQILEHRKYFLNNFPTSYDIVSSDLQKIIKKGEVEDRIFRNWAMLVAAAHCLLPKIAVPFTYDRLIEIAVKGIQTQGAETFSSNEISTFWELVQYMDSESYIGERTDYRVDYTNMISLIGEKKNKIEIHRPEPFRVLYINFNRIISLYRKLGIQQKSNVLPADTIKHYLMNSAAYLGKKNSMRWTKIDKNNNIVYEKNADNTINLDKPVQWSTVAYAFEYDLLNISLTFSSSDQEENDPFDITNNTDKQNDLFKEIELTLTEDENPF